MKSVTILVVLLAVLLSAQTGLQAQSSNYKNINDYSLESLKKGIQSDNPGLRRSAIYMAGLYRIEEAVETLVAQLEKEKVPSNRVLIALSLYNIGNPDGMEAVKDLAARDKDKEVKRMGTVLYRQFADINQ
jgi:HEAT repeat protein